MKTKIKIEGLSELADTLRELPKATSANTQRRALRKAAEPIEAEAEALAPRLTGALQRSVTISGKLSKRQRSIHKKESKIEIYIGAGSLPQAITQEFGTSTQPPQPFMRPAWESNKDRALQSIKDILKEEIEKARQRLARKAARLLAKAAT